ncbi:MAG: hypothetical protein J7L96_10445, partial [Bacteroidales bacterium]|nr:hypothetical protein [Bacteroidales bacterium]
MKKVYFQHLNSTEAKSIDKMVGFHWLDWAVLGLFALVLVGIIIWVSRMKEDTSSDYFLAGRDATWLAIGAS